MKPVPSLEKADAVTSQGDGRMQIRYCVWKHFVKC